MTRSEKLDVALGVTAGTIIQEALDAQRWSFTLHQGLMIVSPTTFGCRE